MFCGKLDLVHKREAKAPMGWVAGTQRSTGPVPTTCHDRKVVLWVANEVARRLSVPAAAADLLVKRLSS